jgi:hypothetical protein
MTTIVPSSLTTCLLSAAAVMAAATACAPTRSNYDLYLVPREEFSDSIERMVLAPVAVEAAVEVPESVLMMVDSVIADRLSILGFSVIPSVVYEELWTRIVEESGGFFDPYTGERHEQRFQTAVMQLKQELRDRFDPDALVYPEIWLVEAENAYGTAMWDGASQSAARMGALVMALSLIVTIEDIDGNELYVNGGGIALAERYSSELSQTVPAAPGQIFEDPERVVNAVDVALEPLASKRSGN